MVMYEIMLLKWIMKGKGESVERNHAAEDVS
jgi:hypothetical protein